jgi:hypothetical protein
MLRKITSYFGCFILGIIFVFATKPFVQIASDFLIGFEIQSKASFPGDHLATLYTKGGPGDQRYTFEVDGKTVWISGDAPGGNNHDKIFWDETGHIVTLELRGEKVIVYDAMNREVKHKGW